ncbi:hypothetical protein GGI25_005296 [Coemansia spiralis]|uniref:Metallo-beta-lactamase domain-containing protein n=2 Tax=Coemansia TaxID=4863 RepID=A0A9W8KW92_9FUNG|nr:beta-lactamase-like protein [Coemansia spiralis]KAJ1988492.1 hypothetical protein EDC05_005266 [Coemansia umbellata]KAJ2619759.1 hypothetical protein GGI26_005569 [Coemansia sp. RSA 1358]KAJ2671953.1 hypothetical protein GGI25_005296 [Coemansia spiralis]
MKIENNTGSRVRELIFLGTGGSSCLPKITCVLAADSKCKTCNYALTTEGWKNKRRNTALLVRIDHPDSSESNVLIDCGKTFHESALEVFVKHKIRRLDAVLITHGHADAILGLDHLRQWTVLAGKPIPVYTDKDAFIEISRTFPYLLDTKKATNAGGVPSLEFRVIDETYSPFSCQGMMFQPLRVEHGKHKDGSPFYFTGYKFDGISYVSDCSKIPSNAASLIAKSRLLILDASKWEPGSSHFGYWQALDEVRRLRPHRTLLTNFSHALEHSEMEIQALKIKAEENLIVDPAYDGMQVFLNKW